MAISSSITRTAKSNASTTAYIESSAETISTIKNKKANKHQKTKRSQKIESFTKNSKYTMITVGELSQK